VRNEYNGFHMKTVACKICGKRISYQEALTDEVLIDSEKNLIHRKCLLKELKSMKVHD
jgi:hydrogenase maturation factor HypF (carbamoyltransferase family)